MRPFSRTRVILQPAGGPDATSHYLITVRNPVRLSALLQYLPEKDADALATRFPTGWVRVWGVTPGIGGVNRKKWFQFAEGDRVLFCGQGRVFSSASLRYRLHNRPLALSLWGSDTDGNTWEHVYFVGDPKDQNIPIANLAKVIGFALNYVVLGVNILDETKSSAVLRAFDLADD
jgi:hypothetical protein